eukprot:scaffold34620_cov69-Phaeocystis_antarctica.AAC.3
MQCLAHSCGAGEQVGPLDHVGVLVQQQVAVRDLEHAQQDRVRLGRELADGREARVHRRRHPARLDHSAARHARVVAPVQGAVVQAGGRVPPVRVDVRREGRLEHAGDRTERHATVARQALREEGDKVHADRRRGARRSTDGAWRGLGRPRLRAGRRARASRPAARRLDAVRVEGIAAKELAKCLGRAAREPRAVTMLLRERHEVALCALRAARDALRQVSDAPGANQAACAVALGALGRRAAVAWPDVADVAGSAQRKLASRRKLRAREEHAQPDEHLRRTRVAPA